MLLVGCQDHTIRLQEISLKYNKIYNEVRGDVTATVMFQENEQAMNLKTTFLILCVLGTVLPLSQFVPWVVKNGLDIPLFVQELFLTKIGGFFAMDVFVSAVVLFVFVLAEGKRLNIPNLWIPVVATLSIGVSLGLPLFLYMRQKQIESKT